MTLKNDWVDGPTDPVTAVHMNAVANTVNGLVTATSNVDNTHDLAKPVSTPQQTALDLKQRKNAVDIRDYLLTSSSPLGADGTVFDIAAVIAAMEVNGGECWIPPGDWTPNAFNIALDETLVTASPSDVKSAFTYKFRGAGKHSRLTLPAGMNTGDYLLVANLANTNTLMAHPKTVFEDFAVKSSPTVPSGSFRSLNGGFAKVNQRSLSATRVYFDRLLTGFYTTGYCDVVRMQQIYGGNNMTAGGWVYQSTATGDGVVIDQMFCNGTGGIFMWGCLGATITGCVGGYHQFYFSTVVLEGCHIEGDQYTSATPVVTIKSSNVDVISGAYYAKTYHPSFSIDDSAGGAPSRVVFHEGVLFLQPINDPASATGAAKCVDVDVANIAAQSEIVFKGCKSTLQYQSTALGTGGGGLVNHVGPLVTASGVAAIQSALTAAPLRTAMPSTIRSTASGVWEIAPTNRLPIPTKAIAATSLSGTATTSTTLTTDGANATYYYKAWVIDVAGRNTAPSSEVSVTTTSPNPIAALTFNASDAPVQLLIERGTVSGTYTKWVAITVTDMAQTIYDQGSYIAGQQWSATSVPSVPASSTTQSGLLHYTSGLADIRASAAPTTGAWLVGDRCDNTNPASGPPGWVCTASGSPGTWVETNAKLATARTIDGQSFDGSANITVIAPGTHAATGKTTPVDADEVSLVDSAASNVLKKLTWANLKATLKSYFDTLYVAIGGALGTPSSGTLTNTSGLPIAGLVASTSTALGVGSVELGHATDTTIARSSAGRVSVEGVLLADAYDVPFELTTGEPVMPRLYANGTVSATPGVARFAMFTAQKTETITQVRTITVGAAGSATLCRIGIFTVDASDNLTLVASTTNDTSMWGSASTVYTKALTASFSKVRGTRYAVCLLQVGGSGATWVGNSTLSGPEAAIVPRLNGAMTGQTDLQSSVAVGSFAAPNGTNMPYAVLLP